MTGGPRTDLCDISDGDTEGSFDTANASYTFVTTDTVNYPAGVYTFEITANVYTSSATFTFEMTIASPCDSIPLVI